MLKKLKKVMAGLLTVIMVVCLLPENIMISHAQEETIHTLTEQIVINSSNLSTYDNTTITGTCVFSDDDDLSSRPGITIDGVEVHLTIRDLNIETKFFNDNDPAPIALRNGATLYLTVEGVNICDVNRSNAAGISVPKGCTLIITDASSGTLKAFGGNYYGGGAGIGAPGNGYYVANGIDTSSTTTTYTCGTIIINGGTIQARGGTHKVNGTPMLGAAGIGNSSPGHYTNEDDVDFNNMGTGIIEINGGNVVASGGTGAAGIGGGDCNSVESISINGGTINATPGSGGASIGMGSWLKDGSYTYNTAISINGGNITANGNIGYGSYNINESKGNGTLSGGSVNIEDEAELNISGAIRPNTSNCKCYTVNVSLSDELLNNEEKNITAMVEVDGITRTAEYTLTPTNYNVSFGMNCYMNETNIGKNAKITISDGTNTWSKEFILAQDNNLEIGQKICPVTINVSLSDKLLNNKEKNITATLEVGERTRTVEYTLTPTNYSVSFGTNFYMDDSNIGKNAQITITDGTNTWSEEFTLAQNNNLEIGQKMYPVTINVISPDLTKSLSKDEYTLSITDSEGKPVDGNYIVIEPGLEFDGSCGHIGIYVPNGEYKVTFKSDTLNNGETVTEEFVVDNQATELNLHIGLLTKEYDLDLYYGSIEIGYDANGGYVKYSDSEGEHTESYLSSDTIFNISQSSSSNPTANRIAITGWYNEIPINISIDGLNVSTDKESISIGQNIEVNLAISGESNLKCTDDNMTKRVSVVKAESNSILNINGTSSDKLIMSSEKGCCIESYGGIINIKGGTIEASTSYIGAAIGSGSYGNATINISGGTIKASTSNQGAAIGSGSNGNATINISGGTIEASTNYYGAAIGSGFGGNATINISDGTVVASTSHTGAAIGSGKEGNATINISGGTIEASASSTGAAIGSGSGGTATIDISGGTVEASTSDTGAAIGSGSNGTATIDISGGNIKSNKTVTATNGKANGSKTLVCKELTIQGVDNDIPITDADNIPEYYGLNDVKTIDGKLYLYLPEDATLPKNILSGEDNYIQHMTEDTKYISHEHILGYTINGTSITENCAGSDVCGMTPTTITLSDPDENEDLMYNGEAYEAETTGTLSTGATASVEYTSLTEGVNLVDGKPVNAGDYRATMYLIDAEGDKIKDGNSNPIFVSVEFTIEKATLTVTSCTAEDRAFDGTDYIQVTEATLSGVLINETVTIQLPVTATLVDEQGEPLIGGVADVTDNGYSKVLLPTLALTGDDKNNYILEQPSGAVSLSSNVMIEKAEAPLLPEEKKTYTYGQTPTVESYSIILPEDCGDISYSFEEDDSDNIISNIVVSDDGVLTYDVEKVDEYTDEITATVTVTAVMDNYQDATFTSSITITDKKAQTLNANDISMTYGDDGKTISLSGNQTEVTYKVDESSEYNKAVVTVDTEGKVTAVNAGTAIIEVTAVSNDIYAEATCQIKVTVAPKPAYITAKSYIIAEKDELPSVYEYDVEGLVSGENLSQDIKDSIKAATAVSDSNKVGDYEIIITGPAISGNYSFSYASGKLTILPADEAPFIVGDDGKMGWDAISDEIDDAKAGDEVVVDMNGATVVPGDILEDVRDKDITISFKLDNGLIWTIDGGTITDGDIGNIDFGTTIESEDNPLNNIPVDVINNITGESSTIEVNLAYSGDFGFTAVLTTNLSSANAGYYANLFYYNPTTKKLEYICADVIASDGTAKLTFTHASDYVIVIDDVDLGNVKEATTPDSNANTGDATPLMALAFMLMLSDTLLVAMSRKKKEI